MLGCLLPALLFAYLIDCTNFVANTAVALVPCHTAYFPALLCSSAVLLSLSTRPTVRFGLSDLEILFSLFLSVPASRLAHLRLFVLSYLYLIISPSVFLSLLCGFALNLKKCFYELNRIYRFIESVEDSETRMILTLRYIQNLSWQKVAFAIGEYDEQYPRRRHNTFFEKI